MKLGWLIIFVVLSAPLWGQDQYKSQIPEGWKVLSEVQGDLNKDGEDDVVILIKKTDKQNIIKDELSEKYLNTNPRGIMVFFKTKNNEYQLIEENKLDFIPVENDADDNCLQDPLELGGLKIVKNILHVELNYFYSCGTWLVTNITYKFRYQNGGFALIGFDHDEMHRGTGEIISNSFNFSTKKKELTTGANEFEPGNPVTQRSDFKIERLYQLKDIRRYTYDAILSL